MFMQLIALDDWKLPVFRERLTEAGYVYTDAGEASPGVTLLMVEAADLAALARVVRAATAECARQGKPQP